VEAALSARGGAERAFSVRRPARAGIRLPGDACGTDGMGSVVGGL